MDLLEESKIYVKSLFEGSEQAELPYHNWAHTLNVFEAASLIASNTEEVDHQAKELIQLACIFHDVGFVFEIEDHEKKGASIAEEFLSSKAYPKEKIEAVKNLILSTKLGHKPSGTSEKIMIDADLSHLGKDDYMDTTYKTLSEEINRYGNKKLNDKDWADSCVNFLSAHHYLTEFAKNNFRKTKLENLEKVKEVSAEIDQNVGKTSSKKGKKKKGEKNPTKADSPLKGVETMFKVALRNHVNLSQIADNKANTLISVNAIIISIVLSALFPKLDTNPFLFYPGVTLLMFTIVTIILSILSTIPNVNRGLISRSEVLEKKGNLLFFGNFYKMSLEDYEWSMNELMNDKNYLYNSLTRDLFFLGKVLNKKYTLLRYSYYSFVIGLLVSIVVFIFSITTILNQ